MSPYDEELSELARLLQAHITIPTSGGLDIEEIADAEEAIGFELPADYRAFSQTFGSILWPYPIADALEACDLREDFNVPKNFAPFGELDHIIAGFRADSPHVWLWDGLKLNDTGQSFLTWLKALVVSAEAREAREAAVLEEPSEAEAAPRKPNKPRATRSSSSTRRSKIPSDAPKRLKKLVKLVRQAKRFETFEADGDRWGLRVPEEGGVRTSYVTAQELSQIETWSGIKAIRKSR